MASKYLLEVAVRTAKNEHKFVTWYEGWFKGKALTLLEDFRPSPKFPRAILWEITEDDNIELKRKEL